MTTFARKLLPVGVVVVSALATFGAVVHAAPARAATNTTVALTFDDARASQSTTKALLDAHGMVGTFYVNSNTVGTSGHLTWAQLQAYAASGSEIAGHTLDHLDLTTISAAQAQAQVCNDRTAIMSHGFTPTEFAYPYGAGWNSASLRALPQACGYSSARRASGLNSSGPYADTIPPGDIWAIKTDAMPDETFSLAQVEQFVTQAETHGGGLVTIVFHENLSYFGAFLDWLQPRAASGTVEKTMAQALGNGSPPPPPPLDTTPPSSSIACNNGAACSSGVYSASVQVSLAATDNPGGSGVASIRFTTDGSTPSPSSAAYSAPFTLASTKTVKFRAYDNVGNAEGTKSQLVQIDAAPPSSTIKCNGAACAGTSYSAAVQVALSATDAGGSGVASIRYTTDGSTPSLTSAAYSAPLTLSSSKTVKYRAYDNAGNAEATNTQAVVINDVQAETVAPVAAIACNGAPCSTRWYRKAVHVSLSATDAGSGVASIRYTTDGSTPSLSSAAYGAPFALSSTKTVKYRAYDNAGNAAAVGTARLRIETTGPAVTITGAARRTSATRTVKVSARVKDGHSRVTRIYVYVDGKLVATDTKPAFSFKWKTARLSRTKHRLSAKAFDAAGNSATKSITVTLH